MTEWRSKLTDKQIDRIIELAAGMAEDFHFADDESYEVTPDRSWCPYNRRGLPGADPGGICSFGCWEEPTCQASGPYPLDELHAILAPTGIFDTEDGHAD